MKYRRILVGLVVAVVTIGLGAFTRGNVGTVSPAVRHFEFTYQVRLLEVPAGTKTLRLWVPLPRTDAFQKITNLAVASQLPYTRHSDPEYHNEYAYWDLPVARMNPGEVVDLKFHVERREHVVPLGAAPGGSPAAGSSQDPSLKRYLAPDRLVPLNGMIAELAHEQTKGFSTPLEKARAIYNYVVNTVRYDKSGEGWGHGDAIWACTAKRGNCTDFHSLFIGMMRSVGIPARFEIGFPLPTGQQQGDIPGYHCWAEFYIEPYGWIPVDASEAWKHPEQREYFFGGHDVNRVLFTFGRDMRLEPAQSGEPLNYFIYPYAEVDGVPFGKLQSSFSFRDIGGKQ